MNRKEASLTKIPKPLKIILFIVLAIIVLGGACKPGSIIPNSNRKSLLSKEGYFLFSPIWHPNGEWIYYLAWPDSGHWGNGSVWKVKVNGQNDSLIINGKFSCLTISHNGEKFALVEDKIIIADTSGLIIDTLQTEGSIRWVKFSKDDSIIYFSANVASETIGYFKINLDGSNEELLFKNRGFHGYFDLYPNDSFYLHDGSVPSLHPQNPNYVVYPDNLNKYDLFLKNLETGEEDSLIADPYGTPVYIDLPFWSPNGDKVVYCVGPKRGDPLRIRKLELWIVENIDIEGRVLLW